MRKVAALSIVLATSACADVQLPEVTTGQLLGAVAGAYVGGSLGAEFGGGMGQIIAMSIGALAGAGGGYIVGDMIDPSDQAMYNESARKALASAADGSIAEWSNPATGNGGIFTPIRTYNTTAGRFCRDYRVTVAIAPADGEYGAIERGEGTACQQADGSWRSLRDDFG